MSPHDIIINFHPQHAKDVEGDYEIPITQWFRSNPTHWVGVQGPGGGLEWEEITFDQASVMNNLHSSIGFWDPDTRDHCTIRLTNAELLPKGEFYTAHWRPVGPKFALPVPRTLDGGTVLDGNAKDMSKNCKKVKLVRDWKSNEATRMET